MYFMNGALAWKLAENYWKIIQAKIVENAVLIMKRL